MNSKERVIRALEFDKPDRVPFNFWMDRRLLSQFEEKYGPDFRTDYYGGDVIETFPMLPWPCGKTEYAEGSLWVVEPLLKEMEKYDTIIFPDAKAPDVLAQTEHHLKQNPDKAIFVNICGPITILHNVRMMDNIFYDIYDYPDELFELCKRVMEVQTEVIRRAVKTDITAIYFQEDICSSSGLMFRECDLDKYIFDLMKEGIALAKAAGKKVVYHSDGNVTAVLDKLYGLGFDAVNPMQPEFNDFAAFKQKYNRKMGVYGGIDNTKIIPYGTEKQIRDHIHYIFETLGKDGGLIMSSHDINFDCPEKNIDIMVKAIKECLY